MNAARPEPVLSDEEAEAFRRGVAQFNAGLFFECHDTLEDLWSGVRGPSRDFFQGLIQVAVAFHHLSRDNEAGAESLFGRALARFREYPERYFGFDLAAHRAEIRTWLERLRSGEAGDAFARERPSWSFD